MATALTSEADSLVSSTFPVFTPTLQHQEILLDTEPCDIAPYNTNGRERSKAEQAAPEECVKPSRFMQALLEDASRMTFTANGDAAFKETGSAVVDLFVELEDLTTPERLSEVLTSAWTEDPSATLRLIWNARSIHLGKSNRYGFYRAMAWLASAHPQTFLYNLPWLVRPLIKRAQSKAKPVVQPSSAGRQDTSGAVDDDDDSDFELVSADGAETLTESEATRVQDCRAIAQFDIKYGHAHGYWKDLLNLLVLASRDQLSVHGEIAQTIQKPKVKACKRDWTASSKKARLVDQHAHVLRLLRDNTFYRKLHLTVARLFADQLRIDLARLKSGRASELKRISMAAKWAPSNKGSHDSHTFVVSTIAELLFPFGEASNDLERTLKLKQARVAYQSQALAPLRKHLDIVERYISNKTFDKIEYSHLPSLALRQYAPLFMENDLEHFEQYLNDVVKGKATVSGATLMPSVLVHTARTGQSGLRASGDSFSRKKQQVEQRLSGQLIDLQWKSLVQRIKDSGQLESSIAVCDVSGSMKRPAFVDGTTPMDSAIGLSLLLAEVVDAPFGGAFITFSNQPKMVKVGGKQDNRSLREKCRAMESSAWGMNTNLFAVFKDLILPVARLHKLKQEEMVKQVFVFSDMQFDRAIGDNMPWFSSFGRIQKLYEEYGYEVPRLVFWNLASSSSSTHAKPVSADEPGTALVSGYSQAMLKLFLDGDSLDGDDAEEEMKKEVLLGRDEQSGEIVEQVTRRQRMTPFTMMLKAVGHEAYRMLRVLD